MKSRVLRYGLPGLRQSAEPDPGREEGEGGIGSVEKGLCIGIIALVRASPARGRAVRTMAAMNMLCHGAMR
jgi:hypothetical protein